MENGYAKLTNQRKTLNQRYLELKEEVKEAEKIRKKRLQYLAAGTAGNTRPKERRIWNGNRQGGEDN